jgi:hypothetical protein
VDSLRDKLGKETWLSFTVTLFTLFLYASVPYVVAVSLVIVSFSDFKMVDQHNNHLFEQYGKAVLEPLPKSSILLVGGQLQLNTVSYLQICKNVRSDVRIVPMEHMKYDWFSQEQGPFLQGVSFPGLFYSTIKEGGYSMNDFLNTNCNAKSNQSQIRY